MAGSTFGKNFTVTTWGESHGRAVGAVIDGCPAGLPLCEEDIQVFLDRRKPGQSRFTTARRESDTVQILSGVFEGKTTGTPISLLIPNEDQRSRDYGDLASCYRPGHADYTFDKKYGIRDYRGGGRSSGRETIGRVAAGAVASLILSALGITVTAYTRSIGAVSCSSFSREEIQKNPLFMPDAKAAARAQEILNFYMSRQDSVGGIIECVAEGLPAGLGDPVFDKLDALLGQAIFSIGAVKGVEIGDGFGAALATGTTNNDPFRINLVGKTEKCSNHAGGVLGGISDGSPLIVRAAIKPTPSVAADQPTVTTDGKEKLLSIHGRHDPVIVPRAVVVVESMTALVLTDLLLADLGDRMDTLLQVWGKER